MQIEDYLSGGQSNAFDYFTVTATINLAEANEVSLLADGNPVNATPQHWVYDGWSWVGSGPVPPPPNAPGNYNFSISLKGPRASHAFTLTAPDGSPITSVNSIHIGSAILLQDVWHPERTWSAGQATWTFPLAYNGPAGNWLLNDEAGNDPAPQTLNVGNLANYAHDFGYWPPQSHPIALTISGSRWTDGPPRLWLRQPDQPPAALVNPTNTVQWVSPDHTGTVWTSPAYQFNATSSVREGVPFWIYDEETGEESTPNQTDLTTWFALPTPANLTGAIDVLTRKADLHWPIGDAADTGGFEIQRQRSGESTWQTIHTMPATPGTVFHYSDPNLVVGKVHSYRVRYTYGSGVNARHSARSKLLILPEWRDTDGDNLPDAWENLRLGKLDWSGTDDSDLDGQSNAAEFASGGDPLDYYNGQTASISLVSGNLQAGEPGARLKDPLTLRVDVGGAPHANAPVTFSVPTGLGTFAAASNAATSARMNPITVRTGSDGKATVYYWLPLGSVGAVTVSAATGLPSVTPVTFTVLSDSDLDGMSDLWEDAHGFDKLDWRDGLADADDDGKSNFDEYKDGTEPRDPLDPLGEARRSLEDVFVDDADAASVTTTGSWTTNTNYAYRFGPSVRIASSSGSASIEFRRVLNVSRVPGQHGLYENQCDWYQVFLWHKADTTGNTQPPSPSYSAAVPVAIVHADNITDSAVTTTVLLNQTINGGKWDLLGTYRFAKGALASVKVIDPATPGKLFSADAIRFARVAPFVSLGSVSSSSANPISNALPPSGAPTGGPPAENTGPGSETQIVDSSSDAPPADEPLTAGFPENNPLQPESLSSAAAASDPPAPTGVTFSEGWNIINSPAATNGSFRGITNSAGNNNWKGVTFEKYVPVVGDYDVYIWFPMSDGNHTYAPKVNVILSSGYLGPITKTMDTGSAGMPIADSLSRPPFLNEGHWVRFPSKDRLRFDTRPVRVTITNQYNDGIQDKPVPNGLTVAADSVRFVKISTAEHIVDNQDIMKVRQFPTNSWTLKTNPSFPRRFGSDFLSSGSATSSRNFYFSPTLSLPGTKAVHPGIVDVWLWWSASSNYASNTKVTIVSDQVTIDGDDYYLDQTKNGGRWNWIAKPNYGSTPPDIRFRNIEPYDKQAVADAVLITRDSDTDWDGVDDAWEFQYASSLNILGGTVGYFPSIPRDADSDGLSDAEEFLLGTDPTIFDTDGDGLPDWWERQYARFNPKVANDPTIDSDGDGLSNMDEYLWRTNPFESDSDHDGANDADEVSHGTNPNNPNDAAQAVDPSLVIVLQLGVGDQSSSRSESYDLVVKKLYDSNFSEEILRHNGGGHGVYSDKKYNIFRKDVAYSFGIEWQGSKQSPPDDNDYTMLVQVVSGTGSSIADPNSILGLHHNDPSASEVIHGGKVAYFLPLKMTWVAQTGFENVEDNKKVTAVDASDNPTTREWMQGKGSRIFPDRKNPTDNTANRNRCILHIKSAPYFTSSPSFTVYLKTFDVDDATPDSVDNDPAHKLDPNNQAGDDNMDTVWARTGKFIPSGGPTATVVLDASGEANVIFETTKQPGDNFRVALAFKQEDLSVAQVNNPSGTGFIAGDNDKQPAGFNGILSPMLTVWRRLWCEFDSMGAPPASGPEVNFDSGTVNSVYSFGTIEVSPNLSDDNNRFENGRIYIDAIGDWKVTGNTAGLTSGLDNVSIAGAAPGATAVNKAF